MAVEAPVATRATRRRVTTKALTVATWNIHGAIGADGRYAPARIVDVLREVDADIDWSERGDTVQPAYYRYGQNIRA
jgi:hypothetical protein